MPLSPRETHSRRLREDRVRDPPDLRRLRGISDQFQPDVDRIRIVRELEALQECSLLVEAKMKHALLVDTRLDVPGDRRGDASRNPTGPNRPDGGSFLDATSEPDQGIAEMAFQSLSRNDPPSGRFGPEIGRAHV